ncbi:hypothetical protein CYMTET_46346 [Cymbomonas tetramitiformis]|uniref:isopentenyl-diphosphate Delta-isomerase n=1 Tax=Cymbomonas tetramitiformis TaxID=36881 RepID=A0AAE0EX58_9CHLO|nr:hypothetical protein CYMTET_46346 [Cymbomonas tetramitiformis]
MSEKRKDPEVTDDVNDTPKDTQPAEKAQKTDVSTEQPKQTVEDSLENSEEEMKTSWDGTGTQEELMYKDECILVDENDVVVGHENKYASHRFVPETPTGKLHRAFSVFLFNEEGKLLLQQRASDKITFPDVWTNTCCSHPLYGYSPTEIDTPEDLANLTLFGVKRAAVRKLDQELGIKKDDIPIENFKYLTRLHYCAKDEVTYGPDAEWGEHEVDYILFIKAKVSMTPNPEEVRDTKYVTAEELKEMMHVDSGLKWSPWFRIIAEKFLYEWWESLETALTTDKFVDNTTIHHVL